MSLLLLLRKIGTSFFDRFWPSGSIIGRERSGSIRNLIVGVKNAQERSGTIRNDQVRSGIVRNDQVRSGIVRNGQERSGRSGTVRNSQEQSGTVRNGQE